MRNCSAQFSQIFSLYEDSDNIILDTCRNEAKHDPEMAFEFHDGTKHKLWILKNPNLHKKLAKEMQEKRIFIADGHHRYETSLNYRNIMRARYGQRPPNKSYEFLMMYLTNINDKGLTILPSHRIIKKVPEFQIEPFLRKIEKYFTVETIPPAGKDISDLRQTLAMKGRDNTIIAYQHHGLDDCYLFSLKPGVRETLGEDLPPSLKKLDVLVLSRFILQAGLGFSKEDLDDEEIFHYESSMKRAISLVKSLDYQMVFLLNPTKIDHVKEVAGNALVMPRKSTFFYPKILSGLVFYKIDPYEIIQLP